LEIRGGAPNRLLALVHRVRRMFDLDADPAAIAAALARAGFAVRPGLRVPGAWDGFELLVRAILGPQVTVAAARALAARVCGRVGEPCEAGPGLSRLFPSAERLAEADVRSVGLPGTRARNLRAVAAAVARDRSLVEPGATLEQSVARLCALPGIGP